MFTFLSSQNLTGADDPDLLLPKAMSLFEKFAFESHLVLQDLLLFVFR